MCSTNTIHTNHVLGVVNNHLANKSGVGLANNSKLIISIKMPTKKEGLYTVYHLYKMCIIYRLYVYTYCCSLVI